MDHCLRPLGDLGLIPLELGALEIVEAQGDGKEQYRG
jgi:hypothetical protein